MRWPWQRVGPAAWEPGPDTLDWDLDLDRGCFGPLTLGAPLAQVGELLGRPDMPVAGPAPGWLFYGRFDLSIGLDDGRIDELSLGWDPPELPRYDGKVRLRTADRRLTTLLRADMLADYGEPELHGDPQTTHSLYWTLERHCVFLDIAEDGQSIENVGITVLDEE